MAGSSNFLPFDENNKNVMSDIDYLASPQRHNGVGNGIADPALHNKIFKQSTMMVSAIAEKLKNAGYVVNDSDYQGLITIVENIALKSDIITTIPDDSITDIKIGNRTLTDGTILTSYTGELTTLLIGLLSMQKLITGKTDSKTAPITSLEKLWNLPWVQGVIITNPADGYLLSSLPLARNGIMEVMDFYITGTIASATTITVKQNNNVIGTVSISVAGKTTLTFSADITGTLDDLFSWTFTGGGLSTCTVVANGKWVNR